MTPDRTCWTDPTDTSGATYPVTGHWCHKCGRPLDPTLAALGHGDHGEAEPGYPTPRCPTCNERRDARGLTERCRATFHDHNNEGEADR